MGCFFCFLGVVAAILVAIRLFMKFTSGRCRFIPYLKGKVFLVTGTTSGIGLETARALAKREATLYLACKRRSLLNVLVDRLREETGNQEIYALTLDLSDLDSVRKCADEFLKKDVPLHCLINNAGAIGDTKRKLTKDNLEYIMATNTFGPFLFTNLLLDKLKESAPSRIVNVSSIGHKFARNFDVANLNYENGGYSFVEAYCASKLGNAIFTNALAKRLAGTSVTTNCLHPGCIHTNILKKLPKYLRPLQVIGNETLKTAEEGCQTTLYLATSPDVANVTGRYFSDCAPDYTTLEAVDDQLASQFWDACEKLTGLKEAPKEE